MALAIDLSPEELRFLLESGYLAVERREYAKAKELFEGVQAIGRGADVAEVGLANLHLLQNQPKEAEKLLRQAIKSNPGNAYAHAQLGELLHTQGKKQEALDMLAKAKSLDGGAFGGMAAAVEEAVKSDLAYKYQVPGGAAKAKPGAGKKK